MWKFQVQKGRQAILLTLWDYCILTYREDMICLMAWAIVCCFLTGPSTTSILATGNSPTPFHKNLTTNATSGSWLRIV